MLLVVVVVVVVVVVRLVLRFCDCHDRAGKNPMNAP